jgi:hypothetical protein
MKALFLQKFVGSTVRHAMTVAGGWMLAEGHADAATVEAITGGVIAAVGVGLSLVEKRARS